MIKTIELIIVAVLLAFSFFAGVKYSESVKEHAGWLFEVREEENEIELPDLSGEGNIEIESSSDVIEQNSVETDAVESAPAQDIVQ